jgi:hypothetical protein
MSEATTPEIDRLRAENDRLKEENYGYREKLRTAKDEKAALETRATSAETERDTLKTTVANLPTEQADEIKRLKGDLQARDHRDAWSAVKDQLNDKVSIEKVWAEIDYKPGDKLPTPEQIQEQLGKARESAPYLFKPADAAGPAHGATVTPAESALPPGPGYARGNPSNDAGAFTVRRSDTQNPDWMAINQGKFAAASAEGRLRWVD